MKSVRSHQKGIGTLIIAAILLLIMSVGIFYANRNIIFAQRTSANQMKQTLAMEVAEAGLQWAIGMLNHPNNIDTACNDITTAGTSFRKQYFQPTGTSFAPLTNVQPGCRRNGSAWTCSCPATGNAALGTTNEASFTVSFAPVAGYSNAVQVTSVGCTPQSAACLPTSTAGADASATVTAILKSSPLLPGAPAAAVTCGTNCSFGGSFNVVNTDVGSNGILVDAGSVTNIPKGTTTLPGQPVQNAVIGSDTSLSSISSSDTTCTNAKMFQSFFGTTLQQYQTAPNTMTIDCNSASCPSAMVTAYNSGRRRF